MGDDRTSEGSLLEVDPTELIEGAISARAAAEQLRSAVREAGRTGQAVKVETPDGRTITGGDDVLCEAVQLEEVAQLDATLATALLLQDVRVRLDELRRQVEPPPAAPKFSRAADVNRAAHGANVTISREELGLPPEDALPAPCPVPGYHPNHLWWGPMMPSISAVPNQVRYFCDGVRYPAPQVRTPQGSP